MINIKNAHKSFESNIVINDLNLSVEESESLTIIGGSGSGKSVLLKSILGLIPLDSGEISFRGTKLTAKTRPAFLESFGMLFQGAALFDSLTVWENVAFRLLQSGASKTQARETAIAKLARVGLDAQTADSYPSELSGGMQKRVGLARAIATDPKVIFFDEPTTGLDPIKASLINNLIRDIVVETKATAITITHDMSTVRTISDRVAMLNQGRIHWEGAISDIDATSDPYVTQFISGVVDGPIATVR